MKFLFECRKYFTSERSEKVKYFFNTSIIGVYMVYSITRVNMGWGGGGEKNIGREKSADFAAKKSNLDCSQSPIFS